MGDDRRGGASDRRVSSPSEDVFLDAIDQRLVLIDNQVQSVKGKLVITRRGTVLNAVFGAVLALVVVGMLVARAEYQSGVEDTRKRSDRLICQGVNDNRVKTNERFGRLADLFDTSLEQQGRGVPPNLQAAYEEWKRPIPLLDCNVVVGETGLELTREAE